MTHETNTYVYHCSSKRGLTLIRPYTSSHGKAYVYATKDRALAAAFLGTYGGDFTCTVGRDPVTHLPFICERFPGAFQQRFHDVTGALYVLPGIDFQAGLTQWDEEVVSDHPVAPVQEITVQNAAQYIRNLGQNREILVIYYPEKIASIPDDDNDIVFRAALWAQSQPDKILSQIQQFHPHLLNRVLQAIASYAKGQQQAP